MSETAADYLNAQLGLKLTGTSLVMTVLLSLALVAQFRTTVYRPAIYWLVVVLVSVVGALVSDNLTDNMGVPLEVTTAVFALVLAATFGCWHKLEGTLSIRRIDTGRREAFYWAAVLFTFVLGTAGRRPGRRAPRPRLLGFRRAVRLGHRGGRARARHHGTRLGAHLLDGVRPDPAAGRLDGRLPGPAR
ncbi:hypothetical protein [Streptomyces sp. NPDC056194]|uniref:hypothetical protein n=1 Tax=unclassified Streptomyces TaxID=2593676 RepID=UPI0035DE1F3A